MICCIMTMDILLHDDNNLFMFIKSKNLITRNLTPKQQQQPQQQQNPPLPKAHNLLILEGWAKSQFFKSQKQLLGLYWKKPYRWVTKIFSMIVFQ